MTDFDMAAERLALLRWEAARLHKASMQSLGRDNETAELLALGAREAARMVDDAQAATLFLWATRGTR